MIVCFDPAAWDQYVEWQRTDRATVKKINVLIKECALHPFDGTGKPEPLRADLSGYWSRRISREHRLVYKIEVDILIIIQCRFHY